MRETSRQIIPEEHLEMLEAVLAPIHEPDPAEDHHCLKRQSRIEFPAQKLAPASFPHRQRGEREHGHHPGCGALAQEAEPEGGMHQGVAAKTVGAALGIESSIGSEQGDGYCRKERCVGRQPDEGLVGKQTGADSRRRSPSRESPGRPTRQQPNAEGGDQCIEEIGEPRRPRSLAERPDRRARHPIRQRGLLAKGLAGQKRYGLVGLPAHPPRDVGFTRLVRGPIAPPQNADGACQRQRKRYQDQVGARRVQQGIILSDGTRSLHGIR